MITFEKQGFVVQCHNLSDKERLLLQKRLSIKDPGAKYTPCYQNGIWNGKKYFFDNESDCYSIGFHQDIIQYLDRKKIHYTDNVSFSLNISVSKFFDEELWDHQKEAVQSFFNYPFGIIKVTTRGGKTRIAIEIIKQTLAYHPNWKFIFFVDSVDLFDQTLNVFLSNFEKDQIGTISRHGINPAQITIAMIRTLQSKYFPSEKQKKENGQYLISKKKKYVKSILEQFDVRIIDEVHEFSSDQRIKLLNLCDNIKGSLSLSATPWKRGDHKVIGNYKLQATVGSIIYTIEEKKLVKQGVIAKNKTLLIFISQPIKDYNADWHTARDLYIVNSNKRNKVITTIIKILQQLQLKTIVFFHQKEHGENLSELTGIPHIHGDDSIEKRKSIQKKFLNSEDHNVIFVSLIWKKGITLPEAEVMINAGGGKEDSLTIQKRGRTLGTTSNKKKALTIDFLDEPINGNLLIKGGDSRINDSGFYINNHSLERMKSYIENNGEENIIILDSAKDNFQRSLKKKITKWFNTND